MGLVLLSQNVLNGKYLIRSGRIYKAIPGATVVSDYAITQIHTQLPESRLVLRLKSNLFHHKILVLPICN